MASSTTNLGLIKPAGNEKIRIAQINQNSDTIDNAIGAVGSTSLQAQVSAIEDGIAIVANGDSHVAITAGQFVYVRNNTHNLAEGLYVASANVSANASITSSNMTADASGGLNALNANLSKLESADEPSGRFASIADLKSYISSIVTGMKTNGALPITFTTDFTDDTFSTGARVYGTLTRRTDSYFSFIGTDILGNAISFSNNGGTWTFNNIANKANIYTYGINANETVYINHSGGVLVFTDRGGMWTEGNATRALTEIAASSAVTVTRVTKNKLQATSSYNYATAIYVIGNGTISFTDN